MSGKESIIVVRVDKVKDGEWNNGIKIEYVLKRI
jgi:hypothetical protein